MWTRSIKTHFRISAELLKMVDEAAKASFQSRSSYIRETLALRLNNQSVVKQQTEEEKLQAIINATLDPPGV